MEQVKIGQDSREYNRIISDQNNMILKVYQPLIDQYHTLNISTLTTEDLDDFFNSPKSFFVTLLTKDEPLTLGGVKLQAEKVYEFMERPAGLDAFVEKLINYKNVAGQLGVEIEFLGNFEPYEIVNSKLQLTAGYKAEIVEFTSYYATTEKQLNAFNLINEVISKLADFNTIWNDTPIMLNDEDNHLIHIAPHRPAKEKISINIDQLLRYTK
ncbi:hypothetical protein ACTS95_14835 [Empedobacter brevis]